MLPCCHWSGALFTTDSGNNQTDKDAMATEVRVRQWCEGIQAWASDNGFTEGSDYLALPGGTGYIQTENHIKIMREYFAHIRGTTPWRRNGPYTLIATAGDNTAPKNYIGKKTSPVVGTEPWWGDATQIIAGTSFEADMEAFVDACVTNGDLGVLFIHNISAGGNLTDLATAGYDMNETQFEALVDYVKVQVDADDLEVITYQDLIELDAVSSKVQIGFTSGVTLTYGAYTPSGSVRTAAGATLPEIGSTGYYTTIDASVIAGDAIVVKEGSQVVGYGIYQPEATVANVDITDGVIDRVSLVDTTTINTDMVGTDDAATEAKQDTIDTNVDTIISTGSTGPWTTGAGGDATVAKQNAIIATLGTPADIDGGGDTLADNLKKIADDNGGLDFDAATDSLEKIRGAISGGGGTPDLR
jgi:hypothetical protein